MNYMIFENNEMIAKKTESLERILFPIWRLVKTKQHVRKFVF